MTLAKLLSDRRAKLRLSVDKVREAGAFRSVATVFRWEHGTRPYPHQLSQIAAAYQLPLSQVERAWKAACRTPKASS